MAEYVEARSLSSLNALAANPPQYPVNPAGKRQDPLTLYISRVPGTRDVILSTFKPQVKNVTSQDVANSLYYVHLDAPEDELLVSSSSPPGKGSGPSVDGASIIPRKPVAGQAVTAQSTYAASVTGTPENISPSRTPNPVEQAAHAGAVPDPASLRRPDQLLEPNANTEPPMRPPPPPIHRKPVGPRSSPATPTAAPDLANSTTQEPLIPPGYTLPPRPDEMDDLPGASQGPFSPRHDPPKSPAHSRNASATLSPRFFPSSRSPSPSKRKPFTPFSLTVIRRDPASGQQWNVGKVASFQLEHPEWIADEKYVPSPSISIHLETSGYNKFRGMPTSLTSLDPRDIKGSLDIMRPGATNGGPRPNSSPEQIANALAALAPPAPSGPHHGYHGFERQVKMGYGPSWTANIREAFRKLESRGRGDDAFATSPPQLQRRGHDRSGSATSVGSFGGDFEGGDAPVITYPGPGLRPQGYVFQSPWGGRCEFRTGNGGRSLRCRHVLPNMGGGYNPLVDAHHPAPPHGENGEHAVGGGHGGGSGGAGGAGGPDRRRSRGRSLSARPSQGYDISELRFNLPSAELFAGKDGATERAPDLGRERMRDRLYNQMHNRTESDVDDDEYYETGQFADPTSLGREKAGGGNRGKRAKMGKLIVAEEGLKMLDLVVAANIGIWWSVWERRTD